MAKLRNIHIKNFKIHKDTKIFANGKRIGNLMVLAGKNDIGKTSVLQALDVFFNDFIVRKNDFFQPNHDIIIECKIDDTLLKKTFNATNIVNERIDTTIKLPKYLLFDTSNSTALTEIMDYSIDDIIYVVENQIARFVQYNLDSNKEFIFDYFWEIDVQSFAKESKVTNLLIQWKKLLEDFNTINKNILIENRGAGVQRICALYYYLMQSIMKSNCQDYIFAIDEPELSLHPEQQRKFIQILQSVSKAFDNIQIIITTHSPYIVNEVNPKDIFVLKHKTKKDKKGNVIELPEIKANPLKNRVLKRYKSMAEINYLAFDEVSKDYHIELFGYIQNQLTFKYDNDTTFKNHWDNLQVRDKNGTLQSQTTDKNGRSQLIDRVAAVDAWLVNANKVNYFKNNINGDIKWYKWYDTNKTDDSTYSGELRTLPYCVRNNIDHPLIKCSNKQAQKNNAQYDDIERLVESIKIMRKAIIDNGL